MLKPCIYPHDTDKHYNLQCSSGQTIRQRNERTFCFMYNLSFMYRNYAEISPTGTVNVLRNLLPEDLAK